MQEKNMTPTVDEKKLCVALDVAYTAFGGKLAIRHSSIFHEKTIPDNDRSQKSGIQYGKMRIYLIYSPFLI